MQSYCFFLNCTNKLAIFLFFLRILDFCLAAIRAFFLCLRTRIFRAVDERFNITIIPKSRNF